MRFVLGNSRVVTVLPSSDIDCVFSKIEPKFLCGQNFCARNPVKRVIKQRSNTLLVVVGGKREPIKCMAREFVERKIGTMNTT